MPEKDLPSGPEDISQSEGARDVLPTNDIIGKGIELINSILRTQISSLLGVALEGEDKEQIKNNAFEAQHCTDIEALTRRVTEAIMAVIAADCFSAAEEKGWSFRWNQGYEQIAMEATAQWLANPNEDISTIVERLLTPLREGYKLLPKLKDLLAGYIIQVRETRHLLKHLQNMQKLGLLYTPLRAKNITASRVDDVKRAPDVLAVRDSLLITDELVQAFQQARKGDVSKYRGMSAKTRLGGGLLFPRPLADIEHRIRTPDEWLVVMAEGEGDDLLAPGQQQARGKAYIHLKLAPRNARSPIITLPTAKDEIIGGKYFMREAIANPSQIAVVDDLLVENSMAHRGLASAARAEAFGILIGEINVRRGWWNRIRLVFAEIFSEISGLWDGEDYIPFPFSDPQDPGDRFDPLSNDSSKLAHLGSHRFPAIAAWKRREKSPAYVQGDDLFKPSRYYLDVTWLTTVQRISE